MQIRDRIKEFRRVPAAALRPNPRNWRTHPPAQRDALRGVLAEVGYAGALLARELPDGALELIDGQRQTPNAPWRIGLIVGPSGSGKSTIAKKLFGAAVHERRDWPDAAAVIDGLGDRPIKEITGLFTAVGFSSPPSWIKPYRVLSTGEQFRCDLARALIQVDADVGRSSLVVGRAQQAQNETTTNERHLTTNDQRPTTNDPPPPLVVFDEFTSVVDRNVARVVSAAIAKGIRTGRIARRFVAVTCHYDVAEWLAPDWIIDMATATFERTPHALCAAESERTPHTPCEVNRRRLRRPPITLEIVRCSRDAWPLFARHHYLSAALNPFAQCYLALWNNVPVAFCATLAAIGAKKVAAASHCKVAAASCRAPEKSGKMPLLRCRRRITRLVTLPGYQGIGIGMALAESVAELNRAAGYRLNITASHPAVIAHCRRSPKWRAVNIKRTGSSRASAYIRNYRGSLGRAVVSFEYAGNPGNANLLIGDV